MGRSDWEYVAFTGEPNTVFIRDLNRGRMSVTNDAEAVVREVNFSFPGKRIVYQDSDGFWDELLHENGVFKGFDHYKGAKPPL
jgi:hypothetical protein